MSQYNIKLEEFEGPLDLLLKLIEDEELDITKVSLAKVTDQFIAYVNLTEQMHPGEMADFLMVASRLLLIKSKVLLPDLLLDEEEEGSLERQLKIYKEYFEASKKIRLLLKSENFLFSRLKPIQVFTPKFIPPIGVSKARLSEIFAKVLLKLEPIVNLPQAMIKKTVSIREKIQHISRLILQQVSFSFKQLIGQSGDRTELIVSFLALLELVKQQTIKAEQGGLFSEINIKKL